MAYYNEYIPLLKFLYPRYLTWNLPRQSKNICLTFDDGPVPKATEFVINTLDKYQIKATFFCVGENIKKHPEVFKLLINSGHSIGNHTYNHIKGWNTNDKLYYKNIRLCDEAISAHGVKPRLFRPPYGKASRSQLSEISKTHQIIMWDVLTGDFDQLQPKENCLAQTIRHTQKGSIVLFHDSYKAEKNLEYALPNFIDFALGEGYQFQQL